MLFRSLDERYYFSLRNGWGVKDSTLYGLEVGLYFDFGHPTTQESLSDECENALGSYHTWGGALAYYHRKAILDKILTSLGGENHLRGQF